MAKLTFGKFKGVEENDVACSYLLWAKNNVKFYKPSEKTLERLKNYTPPKTSYGSRSWANCSDLEICIYGC